MECKLNIYMYKKLNLNFFINCRIRLVGWLFIEEILVLMKRGIVLIYM